MEQYIEIPIGTEHWKLLVLYWSPARQTFNTTNRKEGTIQFFSKSPKQYSCSTKQTIVRKMTVHQFSCNAPSVSCSRKRFEGPCIDTKAAWSTCGHFLVQLFCDEIITSLKLKPSDDTFWLRSTISNSISKLKIRIHTGRPEFIELDIDVNKTDILLILE